VEACPNNYETCECKQCKSIRAFLEEQEKKERCEKCGEVIESYSSPTYGDFDACACDRRT